MKVLRPNSVTGNVMQVNICKEKYVYKKRHVNTKN